MDCVTQASHFHGRREWNIVMVKCASGILEDFFHDCGLQRWAGARNAPKRSQPYASVGPSVHQSGQYGRRQVGNRDSVSFDEPAQARRISLGLLVGNHDAGPV
jgi:hypothetical protein